MKHKFVRGSFRDAEASHYSKLTSAIKADKPRGVTAGKDRRLRRGLQREKRGKLAHAREYFAAFNLIDFAGELEHPQIGQAV